jgi:CheY-like chemotaxis protein
MALHMAADQKDEILGKRVTFFRNKMNWPLKTLASSLGVSIQQLQRYEKGVNKISATTLYDMAKIFKVDVACFYENFEDESADASDAYSVLLVEDNDNDEFLLRKALSDFPKNLSIFTINDGQKALNFLHELGHDHVEPRPRPDIILLDLHLPNLRGFDILKDIKRRPHLQDIPVIVLSSSLNPDDRSTAYALHASGFIRKSFSYDEFKTQLQSAMNYWTAVVDLPRIYDKKIVNGTV